MSLKKLFNRTKSKHLVSPTNFKDIEKEVESKHYVDEETDRKLRYQFPIDFYTASNFAIYGSAEEYYESAIEDIYNSYPYDGSKYEKTQWLNNSSQFQLHIFDNEYPREYGHAIFNKSNSVSIVSSSGSVDNHSNPTVKEYIFMKGGPHKDQVWHTASYRASNLEINGNNGNTIEFWLKKEAFSAANRREVLLDVWSSGTIPSAANYGRLTIELAQQQHAAGKSPFLITYKSGSSGVHQAEVGTSHVATSASNNQWNHYAISMQNSGSGIAIRMYVNGELNYQDVTGSSINSCNKSLIGTIGALATGKAGYGQSEDPPYHTVGNHNLGWGKLSGSIDEFRYWKVRRQDWQIGRHWFTNVHGGANTDTPNTSLGVYYKFNEGIADKSSIDSIVLDYSGRLTNGQWVGYSSGARKNKSAIVQSSASLDEFKDPIIHLENPRLKAFKESKVLEGYERDLTNTSCLINTLPNWILEEEGTRGNVKKLFQIMGMFFDDLYLKIEHMPKLKHKEYYDSSKAAAPNFMANILGSYGLKTSEMFVDATMIESLNNRAEGFEFKQSLQDVKNHIYRNLYNSLTYLYKSKGTEKAFRNILRAYGIDEELVSLNIYSNNATYELRTNYRNDIFKKKYINFYKPENRGAVVYQYSSSFGKDSLPIAPSRGYLSGSHAGDTSSGFSSTTQLEVIFPFLHKEGTGLRVDTPTSSSMFGCNTVLQTIDASANGDGASLAHRTGAKNFANFQVYAVKSPVHEKDAKFVLESKNSVLPSITTPFYRDVYHDKKWNFAVKVVPNKAGFTNIVSGSARAYDLHFYGVNMEADVAVQRFHLIEPLTKDQGENFHKFSKRFYVGASRENYTGSVLAGSDIKASSFRHWFSDVPNAVIDEHAKDAKSFGISNPQQNAFSFHEGIDVHIPRADTLAINWDFSLVTGSSIGGQFVVQDFSSGSLKKSKEYGWVGDIISYNHPARGDFFESNTTASVVTEYVPTVRKQTFENINDSNMVKAVSNDNLVFPKDPQPQSNYFSFEKSMYRTISQEMLDMVGTIKDFGNLIGQPVDRYRQEYKPLGKLRQMFFEKVQNTPDVERYIEYYKWIDTSLDTVLEQFIPATARFSEGIREIIESHALERNKYWTKFPTLEMKQAEPEGRILAINELLYNWKFGHAPVSASQFNKDPELLESKNCLWWQDRAERSATSYISTGDAAVDRSREKLRKAINSTVSGSNYTLRKLTRPYRLQGGISHPIHGGDNFFPNKKKDFYIGTSNPGAVDFIRISGSDIDSGKDCSDVHKPRVGTGMSVEEGGSVGSKVYEKKKFRGQADISSTNKDHDLNLVAPFALYSSSIDGPTDYKAEIFKDFKQGVDITNLHSDAYGDDREIPMQGPFTEFHIGGHQHRHTPLNISSSLFSSGSKGRRYDKLDTARTRKEAFHLSMSNGELFVLGAAHEYHRQGEGDSSEFVISSTGAFGIAPAILREPLAKRPVNIRNIKTKTGSLNLGNYTKDYEIVNTTSPNKDFLVENEKRAYNINLYVSKSSGLGAPPSAEFLLTQEFSSSYFYGYKDRVKPERPRKNHTITSRFSSPGGPETSGDAHGGAHLDVETNQFSLYNSLNYRNLNKRLMLDTFYSEASQQFGYRFKSSVTASSPTASYHKINRNNRYVGLETTGDCTAKADNWFIQHQIPQTDLGYSWIRKSTLETTCSYRRFESDFTDQSGLSTVESASPTFMSSSEIGFRHSAGFMDFPVYSGSLTIAQGRDDNFVPVDFVGLNAVVYEHISSSNTTMGGLAHIDSRGGLVTSSLKNSNHLGGPALSLNNILLNRGGIYGYPSWKQTRAGDHPIARRNRRNNIYTFLGAQDPSFRNRIVFVNDANQFRMFSPVIEKGSPSALASGRSNLKIFNAARMLSIPGGSAGEGNNEIVKSTILKTADHQLLQFTESAVTSKYKPLSFVEYFTTIESDEGIKLVRMRPEEIGLEDARGEAEFKGEVNISFSNMLKKFSNRDMEYFLRIEEPDLFGYLSSFQNVDSITSADEIFYSETIFPRSQNTYLQKSRSRSNFEVNWWSSTRALRISSSAPNSQNNTIGVSSKWLLDARKDFAITDATVLGGDSTDIQTAGEGELLSSAGIFRSGLMGAGSHSMVSASATYARRFPETPKTVKFSFKTDGMAANTLSSGLMEISFNRVARSDGIKAISIVGPSNSTSPAGSNNRMMAYVKLSSSSDSTAKVVDQIVDGLNSYNSKDTSFSQTVIAPYNFKDVARAYADEDKRSFYIEFFESFENAYYPGIGKTQDFKNIAGTPNSAGFISLTLGNSGLGASTTTTYISASVLQNTYLAGATKWDTGKLSGRYPFNYKSYDEYALEMRGMAKDYSIVPEYRISEEMSNFVGVNTDDPFFQCSSDSFLKVEGGEENSSDSSKDTFYEVYSHSDFLEHFEVVKRTVKSYNENVALDTLSLTCRAMKKFLPYEGFYPAQRMQQLSTLFSQSYGPDTLSTPERYNKKAISSGNEDVEDGLYDLSMGSWRTALAPFYAPGLAFNSVKAGIAVDYPLFVPKNDRDWLRFATRFNQSASNVVKIGNSHDWGTLFSGSGRTAETAAGSAISISMWVHPGTTAARWGSLVNFGGDKGSISDPGFRFYLDSGEPKLLVGTTDNTILFEPSGSNLKTSAAGAPRPRLTANKWNHLVVTYPLNGDSPVFYVNGSGSNSVTGSSAGSVTPTSILNSSVGAAHSPDCFIGNLPGSSNANHGAPGLAYAEVSMFNQKLEQTDVDGLYGYGANVDGADLNTGGNPGSSYGVHPNFRGPWRPDLCVSPEKSNSLIGWYRMGNETGIRNGETTDSKKMRNRAGDVNNKIGIGYVDTYSSYTAENTWSSLYTSVDSIMTASFSGFSDSIDADHNQTGYGIISLEDLYTAGFKMARSLMGSYKYPSYITGSGFNETADGGIPRIGTALWAHSGDEKTFWEYNSAEYGIQRVDRIRFEAIVDPSKALIPNKLRKIGEGIFDEQFIMYETEPHPSASLQPCSYMRHRVQPDTGNYYKIHSTHTGSGFSIYEERRDSEAIIWGMPNTSSLMTSSFSLTNMRALGDTMYSKAANNFYAECMSFFLQDGHSTILASDDAPTQPVDYDKTYKMKIRLSRIPGEDFQNYSLPQSFGPPVDAGLVRPSEHVAHSSFDQNTHVFGHGYSPYTPPHFDSFAEVEYTFTPDETELYDVNNPAAIETILNRISINNKSATNPTIKYNRFIKGTGSLPARVGDDSPSPPQYSGITDSSFATADLLAATGSLNKTHAMQISASVAGTAIDDASLIPIFEDNDENKQILRKSWALHTRWEVPNLDFRGVSVTKAKQKALSVPRGMWHQTGNIDNSTNSIEIISPDDPNIGDLSNLLGMHFKVRGRKLEDVKKKNIGTLAERKTIKEAVVAIPFTENALGRKKFFEFGKPNFVYQAVVNRGFKDYMSNNQALEREGFEVPGYIQSMVDSMMNYVIPPTLNFLKYNGDFTGDKFISPFLMYFFEFEHVLTKQDIANIWQNVTPEIGLDTYYRNETDQMRSESTVSHMIGPGHPLQHTVRVGGLENVKWMIFKVKQRAEVDYFDKIRRDRLPINHPQKTEKEADMFKYGFNWPYDYFSLVELIKVDANLGFNGFRTLPEVQAARRMAADQQPGQELGLVD